MLLLLLWLIIVNIIGVNIIVAHEILFVNKLCLNNNNKLIFTIFIKNVNVGILYIT